MCSIISTVRKKILKKSRFHFNITGPIMFLNMSMTLKLYKVNILNKHFSNYGMRGKRERKKNCKTWHFTKDSTVNLHNDKPCSKPLVLLSSKVRRFIVTHVSKPNKIMLSHKAKTESDSESDHLWKHDMVIRVSKVLVGGFPLPRGTSSVSLSLCYLSIFSTTLSILKLEWLIISFTF